MVTLQVQNTASDIENVLDDRNILGLLTVAGSTAGGVMLAERISNRVLPRIGLSADPSTLLEAAGSSGLKMAVALGFGLAAGEVSGLPRVMLAFFGVGALTAAGVDILGQFLSSPELAQIQSTVASGNSSARVKKVSSSTSGGSSRPAVSAGAEVGGNNW